MRSNVWHKSSKWGDLDFCFGNYRLRIFAGNSPMYFVINLKIDTWYAPVSQHYLKATTMQEAKKEVVKLVFDSDFKITSLMDLK